MDGEKRISVEETLRGWLAGCKDVPSFMAQYGSIYHTLQKVKDDKIAELKAASPNLQLCPHCHTTMVSMPNYDKCPNCGLLQMKIITK